MSDLGATVRALVIAIALVVVALAWTYASSLDMPCHEDMACWNCETMGNRICGSSEGGQP